MPRSACCSAVRQAWNIAAATVKPIQTSLIAVLTGPRPHRDCATTTFAVTLRQMPFRAQRSMDDLARFAVLNLVALALAAVWLVGVRLLFGDGRDASHPVVLGTLPILALAALACSLLIAFAHRAWLAVVLSLASGWVLIAGAGALFNLLVPKAYEAVGPGAMAYLWVIVASIGAVPVGLMIRLLL